MSTQTPTIETVGVLGAGRVGSAVARQAMAAGYPVMIATARPPEEIQLLTEIVIPGAQPVAAADIATADLVVVAVPLHKYRTIDPDPLAGKIVIDVMNYWAPTDGALDDFENDPRTSSEIVQDHLRGAKLVKTLNHIGYHDLEADGRPPGAADRRGLAVASDHADARQAAAGFLDRLGYDPVIVDTLTGGRAFQPGTEIFNGSHTAAQLRELLTAARTHAQA